MSPPDRGPPDPNWTGIEYTPSIQNSTKPSGTLIAGTFCTYVVTVYDNTDSHVRDTTGGRDVQILLSGSKTGVTGYGISSGLVVDNWDGTYTITVSPTVAEAVGVQISVDDVVINASRSSGPPPMDLAIIPAAYDLSQCLVTGPNGMSYMVGDVIDVYIVMVDAYGNQLITGGDTITSQLQNQLGGDPDTSELIGVTDNGDGTYDATVAAIIPPTNYQGLQCNLTMLVNGQPITNPSNASGFVINSYVDETGIRPSSTLVVFAQLVGWRHLWGICGFVFDQKASDAAGHPVPYTSPVNIGYTLNSDNGPASNGYPLRKTPDANGFWSGQITGYHGFMNHYMTSVTVTAISPDTGSNTATLDSNAGFPNGVSSGTIQVPDTYITTP